MINFDDYTNQNKTEHNSKSPYTPDNAYRIFIIGGSRSGKANALSNLINNYPDIDKIYLYVKDLYEAEYQCLFKKREKVGLNHYDDPKAFIEYSDNICKIFIKLLKIEKYNLGKKR